MTLACEGANSKLVDVITVADVDTEKHVNKSLVQIWKLKFGHKVKFLFRIWAQGLVKILKLKFRRDFEAEIWSVFCCWSLVEVGRDSDAKFVKILKFKFSRDESSREEIAEKRYFKICLKVVWTTKKHVAPPFKLRDVYNIHHIFQFLQQNTKKTVLACTQGYIVRLTCSHAWNHPETFHPRYGNSICCLTQREGSPPSFIDRDCDSQKLSCWKGWWSTSICCLTQREGDPPKIGIVIHISCLTEREGDPHHHHHH